MSAFHKYPHNTWLVYPTAGC